jgi:hypothetical protein
MKRMDLDGNSLLASLIIGLFGTAIFVYGRRQSRLPQMLVGAVLVVFPYFISSVALMAAIAVGLVVALWGATRIGL